MPKSRFGLNDLRRGDADPRNFIHQTFGEKLLQDKSSPFHKIPGLLSLSPNQRFFLAVPSPAIIPAKRPSSPARCEQRDDTRVGSARSARSHAMACNQSTSYPSLSGNRRDLRWKPPGTFFQGGEAVSPNTSSRSEVARCSLSAGERELIFRKVEMRLGVRGEVHPAAFFSCP